MKNFKNDIYDDEKDEIKKENKKRNKTKIETSDDKDKGVKKIKIYGGSPISKFITFYLITFTYYYYLNNS